MTNKVNKIFSEIKKNDLMEDRREYDSSDLQSAYGLNKKDSRMLFLKIQKFCKSSAKKRHITVR